MIPASRRCLPHAGTKRNVGGNIVDKNNKNTRNASRTPQRISVAIAGLALCTGIAFCGTIAAAEDAAQADQPAAQQATQAADPMAAGMSDFQQRDAGLYPDTAYNQTYLNAGNRGCNSCHESLDSVMMIGSNGSHPIERMGNTSTHNSTILDCMSCHDLHSGDYGMYFADALHAAHYSSATFTDSLNGNCWSCHAMTDSADLTQVGTWSMPLWEEIMYDASAGGFPDTATNAYTREFLQYQGHESGNVTDMSVDSATPFQVEMSQDLTDKDDMFVAINHNGMYGEEDLFTKENTFTITGVKEPKTFTYDDLLAMPQTTTRATMQCAVAGSAGHNIYNAEYTGVSLSYLVNEECGGLLEGNNSATVTAWDGWVNGGMNLPASEYVDNGVIALKMNGEPLTYEFGGPFSMIAPGMAGGPNTKWIKSMDFNHVDAPSDFISDTFPHLPGDELNPVSAAWFANDGETFSMADGVELKGYAYSFATHMGSALDKIEFSTDYGVTWQSFEVPDDFDPYQWTTFTFTWNPPAPGTYVIKVHGVNTDGLASETDAGIIVNVTE